MTNEEDIAVIKNEIEHIRDDIKEIRAYIDTRDKHNKTNLVNLVNDRYREQKEYDQRKDETIKEIRADLSKLKEAMNYTKGGLRGLIVAGIILGTIAGFADSVFEKVWGLFHK